MKHRRLHRTVFAIAGVYNLAWGVFSSLRPQWLFRWTGLPMLNHPAVFACLAMVVGIYGLLYLEVARRPEEGWPIAAVGFLGKVLGPVGLAVLIARGTWPPSAAILSLTNDLVWLPFFAIYLRDAWPAYESTWR